VEADYHDLGYFIAYNLKVLAQSFKQLQNYIKKKQDEKMLANTFLQIGDINERQAQIIRMYMENPKEVLTVKDLQNKFIVTATTAKSDIVGLLKRGLLKEIAFNKVKRGYVKGDEYDNIVRDLEFK
jgi:Fic family protein